MEIEKDPEPKKRFKNFNETFSLCSISLAFAILYPNRENIFKRFMFMNFVVVFNFGQCFWFTVYTIKCLYNLDVFNFARNMTLGVIVMLFFIKTYYVIFAADRFATLLEWITKDLLKGNELDESYQIIYDEYIKQGFTGQKLWLYLPLGLSSMFPLYAGLGMTIESIQTDNYTKLMVHDMELMYVEDIQNEAPFFHLYFAYNCCQCVVLLPNYSGFDASFCIATTHMRMKLKLLTHKLHRAFKDARTPQELKILLCDCIKDHQDALGFYAQLQFVYGPWLFAVFLLTSFMISFNLYSLYLLQRIDPKYTIFVLFAVFHIYLPCDYASNMTEFADQCAIEIYKVPWENCSSEVKKMLMFMIARAQQEIIVTGWIVVYNMELFKSILQTSYSFFTLITA